MKKMSLSFKGKSNHFIVLFLIISSCAISCKKDDVAGTNTKVMGEAKIKIINASPNSTAVDFYFDQSKINEQALAFGESDDIKISAGLKNITSTADGLIEASTAVTFVPTFSYTAFYVEDNDQKTDILTFEDDKGAIETGKTRIRFINLSPHFTNSVDINLDGGVLLVHDLPFKESSMYFSIDPNNSIRFSVLGSSGFKVLKAGELEAGKNYTIWLSGNSNANLSLNKITYN